MTTASPQPAEPLRCATGPLGPSVRQAGEMLATVPSGHWSAATSRSHFAEKPDTS